MASSNIKLFDENKGNMLNDTEFNISTQRLNGLQTGVASSQLQNKAMYQASLIAYAIAQLMLANGKNANDTDAVSTFVNNLLASIVQKVADKATKQDVEAGTVGKWISSELFKSNNEDIASTYLKLAGGTMLGNLLLNADPTSALQAVTKRYVDNNFAKIQTGSYTGTGTYGQSNPCSLTFNFTPKVVMIVPTEVYDLGSVDTVGTLWGAGIAINGQTKGFFAISDFSGGKTYCTISWSGAKIFWHSTNDTYQLNRSDKKYYWVAFG